MFLRIPKIQIHLPNALANMLVIITALGVSAFHGVRYALIVLTILLLILYIKKIHINKFRLSTFFLIVLNIYFAISALIFRNPSSSWLFKNFVYLIVFDLLIMERLKFSKSIFYIILVLSILTLTLNLLFQKDFIGMYSPAFGVPRILSVSTITLTLFLLFNYTKFYHKLFILFTTILSFSLATFLVYILYLLKRFPFLLIGGLIIIILLNFNFSENELFTNIMHQKEKSFDNKLNDIKVSIDDEGKYEISEVLSVELYHNAGILFSIVVTTFLSFYIYKNSGSWMFTLFSWIFISSNPTPLILVLIIANFYKISNNENQDYT